MKGKSYPSEVDKMRDNASLSQTLYLDFLLCLVILENNFDFWQICIKSQCLYQIPNTIIKYK
jgi:hypothetical protein